MKKRKTLFQKRFPSFLFLFFISLVFLNFYYQTGFRIPCELKKYSSESLPPEYAQYAAIDESFLIKQPDKNTVLVFDQVDFGSYMSHDIEAYINHEVLYINITKDYAMNEMDANGSVFYAVITIPDGVTVKNIDTRYQTLFKTVFPKKNT